MIITFLLITFTWIFFRSSSFSDAFHYITGIFSSSLFKYPIQHGMSITIPLILLLFSVEWLRKNENNAFLPKNFPIVFRWSLYITMIIVCLAFFKQNQSFIYFQF
jgi:alginate O-acetyltransferase complex protein AlgI